MKSKMTTNSCQQLNLKKQNQTQTKGTRTGMDSQKQRSHGGLSGAKGKEENGGKGAGNKHKLQVQNRQGEVKNSLGNVEAKELMCTTHGHELKEGNAGGMGVQGGRE